MKMSKISIRKFLKILPIAGYKLDRRYKEETSEVSIYYNNKGFEVVIYRYYTDASTVYTSDLNLFNWFDDLKRNFLLIFRIKEQSKIKD